MSAPIDHKKPAAAFALLCVIAVAVIGNGARARAEDSDLIAEGPAVLHVPAVHGVLGVASAVRPASLSDAGAAAVVARAITAAVVPRQVPTEDRGPAGSYRREAHGAGGAGVRAAGRGADLARILDGSAEERHADRVARRLAVAIRRWSAGSPDRHAHRATGVHDHAPHVHGQHR